MANITVTVSDKNQSFMYDMQVPTDLEFEKLVDDLVQAIIGCNPALAYQPQRTRIFIPKLMMREMTYGETLEDLGVFNGDYLLIG